MPRNKPESRFVKRVNSREGCWYHSRQDHDPSLTPSNQSNEMVRRHSSPLCLLPATIVEDALQ